MFSGLRSKPAAPASPPPVQQAAEGRRRHVASLLGDPLFRAVEKQKDVYEVGFACAAAGLPPNLQLLLSLPPAFPDAAPLVSLKSPGVPVAHPWLDPATMRIVGHPRLGADWITREQSCTLGKVVAEIVREMQLNPPRALGDRSDGRTLNRAGAGSNGNLAPTSGTPGTPPGPSFLRSAAPPEYSGRAPSTSPSSIRTGSANLYRDESSASGKLKFSENGSPQRTSSWAAVSALSDPANLFRSPQPPSPTNLGRSTSPLGRTPAMSEIEIPGIDRMSDAELNELLNDPDAFQDFFLDLDPIKSMRDVSQEVQQGNEQLARKTLAREEELRRLQSEVREKIKAANEAKQELDKKETERDAVLSKFSPTAIISQLAKLAHHSDLQSESIAEAFLSGSKTPEDFLKEFREERKLYHLRNAKVERAKVTLSGRG